MDKWYSNPFYLRNLHRQPYIPVWQAMRTVTQERVPETPDEIWIVEHEPVYTLGQAGRREHIITPGANIPIVSTDRGGQVTYHGPGQLIVYFLVNVRRLHYTIREFIMALEQTVVQLLSKYRIHGEVRREAPGVYVNGAKIAALGLRICQGCCYHGLALNVNMDLSPFQGIHPCGFPDLPVTQLSALGGPQDVWVVADQFIRQFSNIRSPTVSKEVSN